MSSHISSYGAIAGIIGTAIILYKFIVRRPGLRIHAEAEGFGNNGGKVTGTIPLTLENKGWGNAEDVRITLETPTWNFVNTGSDELEFSNRVLDIEYNEIGYIGAEGKLYEIVLNSPVHAASSYKLASAQINIEEFRDYKIDYEITSNSHGPRNGTIILESGYDSIEAAHHHPRWRDVFISRLREQFRKLLHHLPLDLEISKMWVKSSTRYDFRHSFFSFISFPFALVVSKR
ncbi:hypothetical protein [Halorussus pelagicus]|uniref:hypothetical protein n=1 Tax=Halorussus pelagicus TaxID=2505977 RepID=UPI000FFBEF46|nr:hypothetical protein [Halorussus pelagicus]